MSEHSPDIEELTQDPPDAGAPGAGDQSARAAEAQNAEGENPASAPQPDPPEVEAAKWKDYALRQQAELENFRRRAARERQEAIQYANQDLLEALLPILDNFEFGLAAARAESESSSIFQGMSMVHRQLDDFLSNQGAEPVPAQPGQEFDPNLHEAISRAPSPEIAEGAILQVLRRGFRLRGRLLRAANVVVSSGPPE